MKKHLTAGRIALYLLYLGLTTSLIVSVTYSRYAQEIKGQGVAQVAAVALDLTDDNGAQLDLTEKLKGLHPGEQKELVFAVTNKEGDTVSEVAQEYAITISTTGNLPLTYTLAPNNTDTSEGTYVTGSTFLAGTSPCWTGGRLPYSQDGVTHTYTLTIHWPESENITWYMNEIDAVSLTVNAKQAQPTETN